MQASREVTCIGQCNLLHESFLSCTDRFCILSVGKCFMMVALDSFSTFSLHTSKPRAQLLLLQRADSLSEVQAKSSNLSVSDMMWLHPLLECIPACRLTRSAT